MPIVNSVHRKLLPLALVSLAKLLPGCGGKEDNRCMTGSTEPAASTSLNILNSGLNSHSTIASGTLVNFRLASAATCADESLPSALEVTLILSGTTAGCQTIRTNYSSNTTSPRYSEFIEGCAFPMTRNADGSFSAQVSAFSWTTPAHILVKDRQRNTYQVTDYWGLLPSVNTASTPGNTCSDTTVLSQHPTVSQSNIRVGQSITVSFPQTEANRCFSQVRRVEFSVNDGRSIPALLQGTNYVAGIPFPSANPFERQIRARVTGDNGRSFESEPTTVYVSDNTSTCAAPLAGLISRTIGGADRNTILRGENVVVEWRTHVTACSALILDRTASNFSDFFVSGSDSGTQITSGGDLTVRGRLRGSIHGGVLVAGIRDANGRSLRVELYPPEITTPHLTTSPEVVYTNRPVTLNLHETLNDPSATYRYQIRRPDRTVQTPSPTTGNPRFELIPTQSGLYSITLEISVAGSTYTVEQSFEAYTPSTTTCPSLAAGATTRSVDSLIRGANTPVQWATRINGCAPFTVVRESSNLAEFFVAGSYTEPTIGSDGSITIRGRINPSVLGGVLILTVRDSAGRTFPLNFYPPEIALPHLVMATETGTVPTTGSRLNLRLFEDLGDSAARFSYAIRQPDGATQTVEAAAGSSSAQFTPTQRGLHNIRVTITVAGASFGVENTFEVYAPSTPACYTSPLYGSVNVTPPSIMLGQNLPFNGRVTGLQDCLGRNTLTFDPTSINRALLTSDPTVNTSEIGTGIFTLSGTVATGILGGSLLLRFNDSAGSSVVVPMYLPRVIAPSVVSHQGFIHDNRDVVLSLAPDILPDGYNPAVAVTLPDGTTYSPTLDRTRRTYTIPAATTIPGRNTARISVTGVDGTTWTGDPMSFVVSDAIATP